MNISRLAAFAATAIAAFAAWLVPVHATEASWIAPQRAAATIAAGIVETPVTSCEGRNQAPNLLHLAPADGGVDAIGYLVTIEIADPPVGWQAGATSEGYPFIAANTPTFVPLEQGTIAWGFGGEWNRTWEGTVHVVAVGPGGWTSAQTDYMWSIGFDWIGAGYGTCVPA